MSNLWKNPLLGVAIGVGTMMAGASAYAAGSDHSVNGILTSPSPTYDSGSGYYAVDRDPRMIPHQDATGDQDSSSDWKRNF